MAPMTPLPSQEEYEEAQTMLACPHYQHGGTCASLGVTCWEEPVCITGQPDGGWENVVAAYEGVLR